MRQMNKDSYIYIASPYSNPDPIVMRKRFDAVLRYTADCMKKGEIVYSPIVHNHPIAQVTELPATWDFWKRIDFTFLKRASELRVLMLQGWKESIGVTDEIGYAIMQDIPVTYVSAYAPETTKKTLPADEVESLLEKIDEYNPGSKDTFKFLLDQLDKSEFLKKAKT